jgi:predicted nucleic acid-binding protein
VVEALGSYSHKEETWRLNFETSALLPIVIEEPSSRAASRLWDGAERVVSSRLVYAESRAALAMAHRMDRIDERGLREAVEDFESVHQQLDVIEVTESLMRQAGSFAEQFGLRAYDAVHLASAHLISDPEMVFAAGDHNLLGAAQAAGIAMAKVTSQS